MNIQKMRLDCAPNDLLHAHPTFSEKLSHQSKLAKFTYLSCSLHAERNESDHFEPSACGRLLYRISDSGGLEDLATLCLIVSSGGASPIGAVHSSCPGSFNTGSSGQTASKFEHGS